MEPEEQVCKRFEAELAAIAALDRLYYLNPRLTLAERSDYAARQVQLEEMRSRFYAEFRISQEASVSSFHRHCRSIIRRTPSP